MSALTPTGSHWSEVSHVFLGRSAWPTERPGLSSAGTRCQSSKKASLGPCRVKEALHGDLDLFRALVLKMQRSSTRSQGLP